jgi:aldose 1-epimerase
MKAATSFLLFAFSALNAPAASNSPNTPSQPFGHTQSGQTVHQFTLRNSKGLTAKILNYGGILTELQVPDRSGKSADVVLGFDSLDEYEKQNGAVYFGCITGRVANRIAHGKFELDGHSYSLALHPGTTFHLHGGLKGLAKAIWKAEPLSDPRGPALALSYTSPDGEDGYPGTLKVQVKYVVTESGALVIEYEATTDKATPVNLTNHAYFNLAGHDSGSISSHTLRIGATQITEATPEMLPTGKMISVSDTPFDFSRPTPIGNRFSQIPIGGYDHNFVLSPAPELPGSVPVAEVEDPGSGRKMAVYTDQPGLQLYTSTYMTEMKGKGGARYQRHQGFCLETQHHPDSLHHPEFPSIVLRPGEVYRTWTAYVFSAR